MYLAHKRSAEDDEAAREFMNIDGRVLRAEDNHLEHADFN